MTKPITLLANLLNEFIHSDNECCKNRIVKLFEIANRRDRSGFEKWLQFELALFFEKKNEIGIRNTEIEYRVEYLNVLVDLFVTTVGMKNLAIEIKVRSKKDHAIKAMKEDLVKLSAIEFPEKNTTGIAVALFNEDLIRTDRTKLRKDMEEFLPHGFSGLEAVSTDSKFTFLLVEL